MLAEVGSIFRSYGPFRKRAGQPDVQQLRSGHPGCDCRDGFRIQATCCGRGSSRCSGTCRCFQMAHSIWFGRNTRMRKQQRRRWHDISTAASLRSLPANNAGWCQLCGIHRKADGSPWTVSVSRRVFCQCKCPSAKQTFLSLPFRTVVLRHEARHDRIRIRVLRILADRHCTLRSATFSVCRNAHCLRPPLRRFGAARREIS